MAGERGPFSFLHLRTCTCNSLRSGMVTWVVFVWILAFFTLLMGFAMLYVESIFDGIARDTLGSYFDPNAPNADLYRSITANYKTESRRMIIILFIRSTVGIVAGILLAVALAHSSVKAAQVYIPFGFFGFVLDITAFGVIVSSLKKLGVLDYVPAVVVSPIIWFLLHAVVAPYLLVAAYSYYRVLAVGGDGTEYKNDYDLMEMKERKKEQHAGEPLLKEGGGANDAEEKGDVESGKGVASDEE